jgi:hypothetical protein
MMLRPGSLLLATLFMTVFAACGETAEVLRKTTTGSPQLKSINVIEFAPGGVLLVGDGTASQILAVQTGDTTAVKKLKATIEDIAAKLAASMGTTAKGIEIVDLAVNPASGRVYFAVRHQADRKYALLTLDGTGEIDEFSLTDVKYARLPLLAGEKAKVSVITDVAWADDRIVAAGRSNESFSSKIFSIDAPLSHEAVSSSYSAKTYHVSHRRWETKAPMSVVLPLRENGKTWIVGAFSCTPIVKYPLDSLKEGALVTGVSVIELGSGNRPLDMLLYEKNGKSYVLANTFRFHHAKKPFGPSPYWTVRFEQSLLSESENVDEKAQRRLTGSKPATDKIQMIEAFHGVTQMDLLDETHAVVLRKTASDFDLEAVLLP